MAMKRSGSPRESFDEVDDDQIKKTVRKSDLELSFDNDVSHIEPSSDLKNKMPP